MGVQTGLARKDFRGSYEANTPGVRGVVATATSGPHEIDGSTAYEPAAPCSGQLAAARLSRSRLAPLRLFLGRIGFGPRRVVGQRARGHALGREREPARVTIQLLQSLLEI